ncbi:MAG: zinc ABC transporter substrate-binding protein [Paracoccaceae bacterium]|nr:zinc ABC transporter substrate-binding protein [Paracoccaceae bacterium]
MSRMLPCLAASTALMGSAAMADVPNVAADIAPVHSLVARVMDGVGMPELIVQPGASPHGYSLRPSEAAALQEADLVFWIGEDLTPWLADAVETLATGAAVTTLLETDGITLLETREDALFEAHDHDHGHDHGHEDHAEEEHGEHDHGEHDHEDHAEDDHGHDDHAHDDHAPDEHGHDDHAHDDHAHGALDPHAWLSPDNAATWLNAIAAQLSAVDPDNAGSYFANAAAARDELAALAAEIDGTLDPLRGGTFIVFHDAYQYFETDFDFPASGAISLSDASEPGPARIAEIQGRIREEGINCVLAEPQFNAGLVATVLDGTDANTGVVDPLGAALDPGPALYPQLIRNMAEVLADCL